jgi:hypothetical protein
MPVDGELICHKAGHALHTRLCQTLLSRPAAWAVLAPDVRQGKSPAPVRVAYPVAEPVGSTVLAVGSLDESPEAA